MLVLTGDEAESERWLTRYLDARRQAERSPQTIQETRTTQETPARTSLTSSALRPVTNAIETLRPAKLSWGTVVWVMIAAVLINRIGRELNVHFGLSLFLDMIGTCIAAIVLGPWYGAAVAVASQGLALFTYFDSGIFFGLVNVTGALVWGYGIRYFKMGSDFCRFALLGVAAALACSAVGVPINLILTGLSSEEATVFDALQSLGPAFAVALLSENVITSVIDKLLASFLALAAFVYLHRTMQFPASHAPLVKHLGELRVAQRLRPAPVLV
ncbi:energy-coupling factor transport system substrate-specific component [Leucobacter exalbidus]|uniref:Energy-coupling factor transport system substrate-specific component n=1 Tax=Leucobacter exalbidus TaxID=662960 RepID=A0A940PQB2_9MICO|nr:hypothetical protein [Leucobacter exalbidus]MBP1327190.1 energy-coupling factor transport system substrate-specific component [Leucobacter exalbidus]